MTRALLLAERLPEWLQSQLGVNHTQHPILVIGGGACGMTAAVALAQRGMIVEVAERDGHLFSLQRHCTSRWLDPTQYDWPLDIWRLQKFPLRHDHRQPPFSWGPGVAKTIAQKWGNQLSRHYRLVPGLANRLTFRQPIEASKECLYNDGLRLMRVQFNDPQTQQFVGFGDYGAVIWAHGQGNERCNLPNNQQFKGLPFWHSDSLESLHSGLANQTQEGTVLISGGGDGALQDLLRVLTRQRSVRDIYDLLDLHSCSFDLHRILSAELCAERAINWSSGGNFANPYMSELQASHEAVVKSLVQSATLKTKINALVANRPKKTILVTRQNCFTSIYPLNRFLALLILKGFVHPSIQWLTGHEVKQIDSLNAPPAQPTPASCVGHQWRVTLNPTVSSAATQSIDANVVLLRHGIESQETTLPPKYPLPKMPRPRPPIHLF